MFLKKIMLVLLFLMTTLGVYSPRTCGYSTNDGANDPGRCCRFGRAFELCEESCYTCKYRLMSTGTTCADDKINITYAN